MFAAFQCRKSSSLRRGQFNFTPTPLKIKALTYFSWSLSRRTNQEQGHNNRAGEGQSQLRKPKCRPKANSCSSRQTRNTEIRLPTFQKKEFRLSTAITRILKMYLFRVLGVPFALPAPSCEGFRVLPFCQLQQAVKGSPELEPYDTIKRKIIRSLSAHWRRPYSMMYFRTAHFPFSNI